MGNKKQTILILNGRRYNALTGEAVASADSLAVRPISDMVGATGGHAATLSPLPRKTPEPLTPLGSKLMDVTRTTGHTKPRQQQRASTLIRSAVTPPKPGFKSQTKVSAPANALVPIATVAPKVSIAQVNPHRQTRAGQVSKSEAITKFAPGSTVPYQVQAAAVRVEKPAAIPVVEASTLPQDSNDLFERAIANAESHNEKPVDQKKLDRSTRKQAKKSARPVRHHLASVVAASLTVLVIGGVIGLQNKDAITLRFANAQAGFSAKLPTYEPDGYGVGSFTYSAGAVGTTFHSAASDHEYLLEQQTTKWDSQALLDNFVATNYPRYQAIQSGDQVIYIYGKTDASWVKNGIWYQLTSNGNLSTSQVLNIAASV